MSRIRLNKVEPGTTFPSDQALFLLKEDNGYSSITTVEGEPDGAGTVQTFVLGFTKLAKAQRFAKSDAGRGRVKNILQLPMHEFVEKHGHQIQLVLDVNPDTYLALAAAS